jgi:hypothetical protein
MARVARWKRVSVSLDDGACSRVSVQQCIQIGPPVPVTRVVAHRAPQQLGGRDRWPSQEKCGEQRMGVVWGHADGLVERMDQGVVGRERVERGECGEQVGPGLGVVGVRQPLEQ